MIGRDEIFFSNGRLCLKIAEGENVLKGIDTPQNKKNALLFRDGDFTEPFAEHRRMGWIFCKLSGFEWRIILEAESW